MPSAGIQGQIDVAAAYRELLEGSGIMAAHGNRTRVQDPYSLRCQPQVMGACLDAMRFVARTLTIEANAVSDNPIIFAGDGDVISGGNFHAEPVAIARGRPRDRAGGDRRHRPSGGSPFSSTRA